MIINLLSVQAKEELVNKKKKVVPAGTNERKAPSTVKDVPVHAVPTLVEDECGVLSVPEEEDLPPTPQNEKDAIKQKFLVEMPEDFYSFWSFCMFLSPDRPEGMLHRKCKWFDFTHYM